MQYLPKFLNNGCSVFSKTFVWVSIALAALFLCVDIEYEWLLIPTNSVKSAAATNRIILALSYSYIAAVIFHFLVNFCPNKYRAGRIKPYIDSKQWLIKESLRQCKIVVLPVFDFSNKTYTKGEYIQIFSQTDFYEDFALGKGQSKYARIEIFRNRIIDMISLLLGYREFLSDEQFAYLTDLQNSKFITDGLIPYEEDADNSYCNQDSIGECIFDLYEQFINLH